MIVRHIVQTLCLACILLAAPLYAQSGLDGQLEGIFSEFDGAEAPGAAIVILKRGEILYQNAFGLARLSSKEPLEVDTALHLGSVGKQMTAVAILKLEEAGKLSVEHSASRYVPQLRGWGSAIKVRHLLHHTSGIPDYYEDIERRYARPTNRQALKFLDMLGYLEFRPGRKYEYSNSGYDTLGAIVESVSGKKFGQFMKEQIFVPSDMNASFAFDSRIRRSAKRAVGYYRDGADFFIDDSSPLNLLHGSGSIYSTAVDMAKYDRALFGGSLLSAESMAKMFRSGTLSNGRDLDYGFGWDIAFDSELTLDYYGHSGEWMGFSAYYLHYPEPGVSVIVLANSSDTDVEHLAFSSGRVAIRTVGMSRDAVIRAPSEHLARH